MALSTVTSADEAVAVLAARGVTPLPARGGRSTAAPQSQAGQPATSATAGTSGTSGAQPDAVKDAAGAPTPVDLCIAVDPDGAGPQQPDRVELGTYAVDDLRGVGLDLGSTVFDCRTGPDSSETEDGSAMLAARPASGEGQDDAALVALTLLGGGLLVWLGVVGAGRMRSSGGGWRRPPRLPTVLRGG